jgi:ABC-type uncharacterized transport system involved in gliding motility auxiliary subunit
MQGYASLIGWLGGVAILFGLLSLLLQLFSGTPMLGSDLWWILGNFAVGVVLLTVALLSGFDALRERMRSDEARRAGKYGTSALLGTALGIVLLVMLAFLSTRYHARWDWTEARSHSLSPQTLKLLEGLERDVEVTALFSAITSPPARELLDRYSYVSDRFKVSFADPQAQPGLVRGLGISPERLEGGLIHLTIGEESVEVTELSEEKLTNAILKLIRREQKNVHFLIGHNERPVEGEGADGKEGFSFAKNALENENYLVHTLLLAAKGEVPEDADVVILAGPTRPLYDTERKALDRYLKRGGALLVLLDPRAKTNVYQDLARWGVSVEEDVIVDRVQGLFGRPVSPLAAQYGDHPITRELRDATLFHVARSVGAAPGWEGDFTTLVLTSEASWGERDLDRFFTAGTAELDGDDLAGPVSIAVAGILRRMDEDGAGEEGSPSQEEGGDAESEQKPEARLVVIGDSDFAANQLIGEFRNRDLFLNAVNWLLGDVEAISIRPDQARASRMQLSSEQFLQIRYLSLFVLPEAIAVLGVLSWWARRRAPGHLARVRGTPKGRSSMTEPGTSE